MLYLLHFSPRYRHAGHYLGYTQNLAKRFGIHLKGEGSPLVKAAVRNGSRIVLVRIWAEDGNAEQEIKRVVGSRARLCPLCNPRAANVMAIYRSTMVYLETTDAIAATIRKAPLSALSHLSL